MLYQYSIGLENMERTPSDNWSRTPSDIWSYCNFNLKCPNYWNHDECIKAQKINKCTKMKLNKCPKMKCPECEKNILVQRSFSLIDGFSKFRVFTLIWCDGFYCLTDWDFWFLFIPFAWHCRDKNY